MASVGANLLHVLDAHVSKDCFPSKISGALAIGVVSGLDETWWSVTFDEQTRRPRTEFHDELPSTVSAVLVIGELDAQSILERGMLLDPPDLIQVEGDRDLMERFLTRYVFERSLVDVRSGQR